MKTKTIMAVALAASLLCGVCGYAHSASREKQGARRDEISRGAVSVVDLYNEFKKDRQAAADAYSGKRIAVSGVVTYTGPDIHHTPSIELSIEVGGKAYVLCVVNSYDQLGEVSVGDTVTMTGTFHIFGSDDWVVLKQSEVV